MFREKRCWDIKRKIKTELKKKKEKESNKRKIIKQLKPNEMIDRIREKKKRDKEIW